MTGGELFEQPTLDILQGYAVHHVRLQARPVVLQVLCERLV